MANDRRRNDRHRALPDAAICLAKATDKQFDLQDEGGLFLIVKLSGGKLWPLKYPHLGKEQQVGVGRDPDVGLKDDRKRRVEARKPDQGLKCQSHPGLCRKLPGRAVFASPPGSGRFSSRSGRIFLIDDLQRSIFPIGKANMIATAQEFGHQVAAARRALGLTQRDLALAIGTGERFVVDLEGGKPTAQLGKALAAAKAVGIRLGNTASRS
jgi:y4mF family transcriptional regulator